MRKFFVLAAFVCIAATGVNAQTEETESKNEKMLRLTKAADENPTDWKTQLEAGHFLLGKENGMSQAEKYYERIFHLATDYNKEIPDSVIRETGWTLAVMSMAPEKKNLDRALFYIDVMRHADKMGVDMGEGFIYSFDVIGVMCGMMKEESERSLFYMTELRNHLAKEQATLQQIRKEREGAMETISSPDYEQLQTLVSQLPQGCQQVFRLSVFEGLSHQEISQMLGISPHTSSSQLSHAKRMLRQLIRQSWVLILLLIAIP